MRVLITGATGGLGRALRSMIERAHPAADVVPFTRGEVTYWAPECAAEAVKVLAAQGGPFDSIVHCAGAEVVSPLRLTSNEQYGQAMACAEIAFGLLRAAATKGVMVEGGSIVLMSSVAAHRGTAGMTAYAAGKAAIEAMMRCAAVELAPRHIRVNAIAAGAFRSPMHERITKRMPTEAVNAYFAKHPLGFGTADAVAEAVLHLLSPAARWITGTVQVVDGGYLAA